MRNFDNRRKEAGFTILELMVASALGLTLSALIMGTMISAKRTINYDLVRTRVDQNIRSALEVVSSDIRVGGENLNAAFPAFEIVNGTSGAPDELIIRRNLLDEVLTVCQAITAGNTTPRLYFAVAGATASSCTYSGQAHDYNAWRTYRIANTGSVKAYVYNVSSKLGEFFTYNGEVDGGNNYYITRTAGAWVNAYPLNTSSAYILEEWRFRIVSGTLQLLENGDTATPKNIVDGLTNFQVNAIMQDGTVDSAFDRNDSWSLIDALDITITGQESTSKNPVLRTINSRYFPRNILSQ